MSDTNTSIGTADADAGQWWDTDTNDEVATAPATWRPIADAIGGFDLDPAAGCEPVPIADERFTEADNGLSRPWHGTVWLNPPFSDKLSWFRKLVDEYRNGAVERAVGISGLIASAEWFQRWVVTADVVCFPSDRDLFHDAGNNPSFASVLGAWNPTPELVAVFERMGAVMTPGDISQSERSLGAFV